MSIQTAVRLPEEVFDRLRSLADRTGRTATYYIREAVVEHLEDLEDAYLGEQALERLRRGEDRILTSEEFWRGVDD